MTSNVKRTSYAFASQPDPALVQASDKRILIVDDEEPIRRLFATILSAHYSCATASNAEEALVMLSGEEFALVISDVIMPGLSGIEFLRKITESYPETGVIIVSGIDRTQRVLDAVRLGAFDYLLKPCEAVVLERCVERALERRALLRAARHYKHDLEKRNEELARRKSELERLYAQIVHNEKMASLGQLAAGVAHELNNPAGFIYGNMEVLKDCAADLRRLLALYDEVPLEPETAARVAALRVEIDYENTLSDLSSIIADCREGAERISDIVQNLRTFSRLDEAEVKRVDIHEGIESTIRLLSRFYSAGHIALHREYKDLPLVDCYAGQLNQVWMNLLVNAAQAIDGAGEVRITTGLRNEMALVSISDTGSGITPEDRKKIFDPFFTTKPIGEGTGLGLSTSYSIVRRHGGLIGVDSTPGRGTTFTVALPIKAKRYPQSAQ